MSSETMSETIEFLTQIHTAWDETEQRMALRENPRRYISYHYTGMETWQSQYLRALTYSSQTTQIEFPLWHASRMLPNNLYKSQSIIQLSKIDMWNYRNCHATMLWASDKKGGERLALQSLGADGMLHLNQQLTDDWESHRFGVVPVVWGVLQQEDSYTNMTSNVSDMNINVELLNNGSAVLLPEAINEYNYPRLIFQFSQNADNDYLGSELFMMPPPWSEDISSSYTRNANRLDNETGSIRYDLKSTAITETKTIDYIAVGKEEVQFLQRFFYRCKGQLKSFYMPTWVNDVDLAADAEAGTNILYTKFVSYWKYYKTNARRKIIVVFYKDCTIAIMKIAGYSLSDDGELGKIYLSSVLKKALRKNNVLMISYLTKCRSTSDKLVTDYMTVEAANLSMTFKEVDG